MARLDRLAPAREVAQIAACIGREFDEDVVRAVAGCPEPQLAAALGQLCLAGLIHDVGRRRIMRTASSTRSSAMRPTRPCSIRPVSSCTRASRKRSSGCGQRSRRAARDRCPSFH